jgi:uracil-DNA glycosylase family 4
MDALAALSLQIEWGADEALDDAPLDRTRPAAPAAPAARAAALPVPPPSYNQPAAVIHTTPAARAKVLAEAAPTLAALRDAVAGFTACPLAATATNLVFADGNPEAGIVLVGETPGPEEDMSGRPLDGKAGALLDRMLASIGLDRGSVLITSLIPWRPPGGRQPTQAEIAMCLPFLLRHLALLRPRVVVTLGGLPAQMLTGSQATIRKLRGNWQSIQLTGVDHEVKLLPMIHPAMLIRMPAAKREAWHDLLALQRVLNSV